MQSEDNVPFVRTDEEKLSLSLNQLLLCFRNDSIINSVCFTDVNEAGTSEAV